MSKKIRVLSSAQYRNKCDLFLCKTINLELTSLFGAALNAGIPYKGHLVGDILSQKINGRITNYRIGIKSQKPKECLVEFSQVTSASLAGKLIGQKVVWINGKDKFTGKIASAHGRNGTVRVKFARPVPGQAIGKVVELIS